MKKFFSLLAVAVVISMTLASCSNGAKAQEYDSYTKEVQKLLQVTDAKSLMETGIVTMLQSVVTSSTAKSIADDVISEIWDDYLLDCSQVYQKYYSLEELKAVNDFYATPAGEKLAKYTNDVTKDLAKIVQDKYSEKIQSIVMKNL